MKIIPYSDKYKKTTVKLIISVLKEEFGFKRTEKLDFDLHHITEIYQQNKGNFWLAVEEGEVIGTIALRNYGRQRGYLKRMYVAKNFRETGVADKLLNTLFKFVRNNGYKKIFLGTVEKMIAANKFYSKRGFKAIKSLPKDLPEFNDTIFYKLIL